MRGASASGGRGSPAGDSSGTQPGGCRVLYIGGFELPDQNAAAHRVIANAKLLSALGYETVFLHHKRGAAASLREYAGFLCHEFPEVPGRAALVRALWDITTVVSVIEQRGDIGMLIAYNYPGIALARLKSYCRKHGIQCVADVTDWYGSRDRSLAYKIVKGADTLLRMRVVHKRLDGLIVISRFLEEYYRRSTTTVSIPPLYDAEDERWLPLQESSDRKGTRLVYAGSPSNEKERLDVLVSAVIQVGRRHPVSLDVVGITEEQFRRMYRTSGAIAEPGKQFGEAAIAFHGRLSHEAALAFVKRADYTVVVREPNRVTMAGFPTKFVESIACGTPVIASPSSNLAEYLTEGRNGHLVGLDELATHLERIVSQDPPPPVDRSSFDYHTYLRPMGEFMSALFERQRDGVLRA